MSFTRPRISPHANAFSMHTRVPGPRQVLLPKRFAGMGLLLSIERGTAMIPLGSIVVRGNNTCVCMVHGSSAMREHFVRLKPRFRGRMIIRENLTPRRSVIVRKCRGLGPNVGMGMDPTMRSGGARRGSAVKWFRSQVQVPL